jgi:sigma-B regulation protein RsbU (phosphoserine phosphatase)
MGAAKRAFFIPVWLIRSLLLKLTPIRRLLLAVALVMGFMDLFSFRIGDRTIDVDYGALPFLILLFILMLELKDKLVARDEIAVARQVQLALLPSADPRLPGFALWSHTRPANDVGGDLIDYLEDPLPRSLGVALGDVAGKGLGAALLMAKLQASLRAIAPGCPELTDLGARLNRTLFRDGLDNRFATLFYLELPRHGPAAVRYLNAGHNPPLLVRASGVEQIDPGGRPLGMFGDSTYADGRLEMQPEDLLIVYSDGLVEASNAADAEFGLERLLRLAPALRAMAPEQAGRVLLSEVDRFLGAARPQDDLSIILVRRQPAERV